MPETDKKTPPPAKPVLSLTQRVAQIVKNTDTGNVEIARHFGDSASRPFNLAMTRAQLTRIAEHAKTDAKKSVQEFKAYKTWQDTALAHLPADPTRTQDTLLEIGQMLLDNYALLQQSFADMEAVLENNRQHLAAKQADIMDHLIAGQKIVQASGPQAVFSQIFASQRLSLRDNYNAAASCAEEIVALQEALCTAKRQIIENYKNLKAEHQKVEVLLCPDLTPSP